MTRPQLVTATLEAEDDEDRAWLTGRLHSIAAGIAAAHTACVEIATNWRQGRQLGRLFPNYGDPALFLLDHVGSMNGLPRKERDGVILALVQAGSSRRTAARATGASPRTANRVAGAAPAPPGRVMGIDGKSYPVRVRALHEPSVGPYSRLIREIDALLGPSATLHAALGEWQESDPPEEQRRGLEAAYRRLEYRLVDVLSGSWEPRGGAS